MKREIRELLDRKNAEQNQNNSEQEIQPMADEPKEQTFTQSQFEQMIAMFQQMQEGSNRNLLEAVKVLKEPDEYTKEQQDKQRKRDLEHRVNRMRDSVSEERKTRQQHFNCSHVKSAEGVMKESHAFVGQVNNDMHYRPICCRCQRTLPKVRANDEQIRNGVGLRGIDLISMGRRATPQMSPLEIMLNWHKHTVPDCPDCAKGLCAVQQLRELKQGHLDPSPEILPDGKVSAEAAIAAMAAPLQQAV